jgi:murein DD-endopeptidase MepM/ murein hydrolase activator NlpD
MRAIKLLMGAILLAAVGAVWSQAPAEDPPASGKAPDAEKAPPPKDSLEQLLTDALRNSPEIQLAEAKVREAEAELRRTRMQIMQRVVEQESSLEANKRKLTGAEANFQYLAALRARGTASESEVAKAKAELETAKAAAKQAELSLNGLIGKWPAGAGAGALGMMGGQLGAGMGGISPGGVGAPESHARPPLGPMADRIRKALDKTVKIDQPFGISLRDVPRWLRDNGADVPFLSQFQRKKDDPVEIHLTGEITLGAAFQALQDSVPGLRFFVREYGILITLDNAGPENGKLLLDFWREAKSNEAVRVPRPGPQD